MTLPEGDYDTVTGLVFDALGQVPQDGSQLELTVGGLEIQVEDVQEHQITSALVRRAAPEEQAPGAAS